MTTQLIAKQKPKMLLATQRLETSTDDVPAGTFLLINATDKLLINATDKLLLGERTSTVTYRLKTKKRHTSLIAEAKDG